MTLIVEGWSDDPGYKLALSSIASDGAVLLAVMGPDDSRPERALVWMPTSSAGKFVRKLREFATEDTNKGIPKNLKLVANIKSIERAVLQHLWQEEAPFPDADEVLWWEVWFAHLPDLPHPATHLPNLSERLEIRLGTQTLTFRDRTVAHVHATAAQLGRVLSTNAVIAELHRPLHILEVFAVDSQTQRELIDHLADRIEAAPSGAPAVCQLDTGVAKEHPLLRASVDVVETVIRGTITADEHGHGTRMAGLALFGDLREPLAHNGAVRLAHRLESVKVVEPDRPDLATEPELYGAVTAEAVARVEINDSRRGRVFAMPVTASDGQTSGRPSSWSAAVDALAIGTDITNSPTGIALVGTPETQARRLIIVSAGNVNAAGQILTGNRNYLSICD
ncbi:S8 family serine peptidase [Microbispora hainanensis]|uniref:S8 family serine peptidase n=1 Tax=Microbispora hainanensis TaxID=568844 RepID=UPI002E2C1D81|nr:S8 family serine peptidase [Microbispora hainanensis]